MTPRAELMRAQSKESYMRYYDIYLADWNTKALCTSPVFSISARSEHHAIEKAKREALRMFSCMRRFDLAWTAARIAA